MTIQNIHIEKFSGLTDFTIKPCDGVNIVTGNNESGKSTVSAFIKYIFYGFANKAERVKSMGWGCDSVSGSIVISDFGKTYALRRETTASGKEKIKLIELESNKEIALDEEPGMFFFKVPSNVFCNTVFVRQIEGTALEKDGMSSAFDNILFSADEKADVGKALKKLDDVRVDLLHKNKKGGKIFELEQQIDELSIRIANSEQANAEIREKSSNLENIREKYKEKVKNKGVLSDNLKKYNNGLVAERLAEARAYKAKLENARLSESVLKAKYGKGSFIPDEEYLSEIKALGEKRNNIEKECSEIKLELAQSEAAMSNRESREFRVDELEKFGGKAAVENDYRKHKKASNIFMISAIVCLCLCFTYVFCIYSGIAFSALALVSFVLFLTNNSYAKQLLNGYGADNEKALSMILTATENDSQLIKNYDENRNKQLNKLELLSEQQAKVEEKIKELALKAGCINYSSALEKAETAVAEFRSVRADQEKYREYFNISFAPLKDYSKFDLEAIEKNAPSKEWMEKFPLDAAKKELEFYNSTNEAHKDNIHNLEKQLTELIAKAEPLGELIEKKEQLVAERLELLKKYSAITLAYDTLENANIELKNSIGPKIAKEAGNALAAVSKGRYSYLGIGGKSEIEYAKSPDTRAESHDISYMSAGTSDIAYLSIRMALASFIFKESRAPMIFDESFVRLDDTRLSEMLKYIYERTSENNSATSQVFIFTSHKRESEIMSGIGGFNSVVL